MGRRRLIIVLAAFCAAGCMLTACGGDIGKINGVLLGERGASLEGEILGAGVRRPLSVAETGTFSYSSNSESQWVSVNETGIFYISEDVFCYYDYDTENRYALCSMPGCKHNDGDCNAYVGDMEWYGGYTLYDGEIYYLCKPAGMTLSLLTRSSVTPVTQPLRRLTARSCVASSDAAGRLSAGSSRARAPSSALFHQRTGRKT